MKVKTDHPNYLKDLDNNAILANDKQALLKHRKKLSESQQINNLRNEVNDLKHKLETLESYLLEHFSLDQEQPLISEINSVKKELEKNNLEACILFDPVNVRYALDTLNMSVYNMHNLTRFCFIPVSGPVILYEYFNCENLSNHLNLIDDN